MPQDPLRLPTPPKVYKKAAQYKKVTSDYSEVIKKAMEAKKYASIQVDQVKSIADQTAYIKDYINSHKYASRLYNMTERERELAKSNSKNGKTLLPVAGLVPDEKPTYQVTSDLINAANKNISSAKISTGKNIGNDELTGLPMEAYYDDKTNKIKIRTGALAEIPTIPVHELSHASTDGKDPYSNAYKYDELAKHGVPVDLKDKFNNYVQQPTEFKARVDAIRYLMKKNDIVDPGKQDISAEHLNRALKSPEIMKDDNMKSLMMQIKSKDKNGSLLWILNNIAKNGTSGNGSVA